MRRGRTTTSSLSKKNTWFRRQATPDADENVPPGPSGRFVRGLTAANKDRDEQDVKRRKVLEGTSSLPVRPAH